MIRVLEVWTTESVVSSGDRVEVTVQADYEPMVRLIPISARTFTSSSARTYLGLVALGSVAGEYTHSSINSNSIEYANRDTNPIGYANSDQYIRPISNSAELHTSAQQYSNVYTFEHSNIDTDIHTYLYPNHDIHAHRDIHADLYFNTGARMWQHHSWFDHHTGQYS